MKYLKTFLLLAALVLACVAIESHASGCGWSTRYEEGPFLSQENVTGRFTCHRTGGASNYCSFETRESPRRIFWSEWMGGRILPDESKEFIMVINVHEGMEWEECEPGNAVPPFYANGILRSFRYSGVRYQKFSGKGE